MTLFNNNNDKHQLLVRFINQHMKNKIVGKLGKDDKSFHYNDLLNEISDYFKKIN